MPIIADMLEVRVCKRCGQEKQLTAEFWYVQRARDGHPKGGWQSHCRECWRQINKHNKQKRKLLRMLTLGMVKMDNSDV